MDIIYQGINGNINVGDLILTDKPGTGDGSLRAVASGTSWVAGGFATEVEAVTVDTAPNRNESGKTFTNSGASSTTTVSLPDPEGAGIVFHFVRVAGQAFRVDPQAGDAIIYSGGQMSDGEYLELASNGAKLSLVSDSNSNWVATNEFGTLTEETP